MGDELGRKGLGVHQLLDMELPGDLTLREAKAAVKHKQFWKDLCNISRYPDRVELLFGWRYSNGKEEWAPDWCTLDGWKGKFEAEAFISISDGFGGVKSAAPEPELVS